VRVQAALHCATATPAGLPRRAGCATSAVGTLSATGRQAATRLRSDQVTVRYPEVSGALLLVLGVLRLVECLAGLRLKSPHAPESDTAMSTVLPQPSSKREEVASGRGTGRAGRGASV